MSNGHVDVGFLSWAQRVSGSQEETNHLYADTDLITTRKVSFLPTISCTGAFWSPGWTRFRVGFMSYVQGNVFHLVGISLMMIIPTYLTWHHNSHLSINTSIFSGPIIIKRSDKHQKVYPMVIPCLSDLLINPPDFSWQSSATARRRRGALRWWQNVAKEATKDG